MNSIDFDKEQTAKSQSFYHDNFIERRWFSRSKHLHFFFRCCVESQGTKTNSKQIVMTLEVTLVSQWVCYWNADQTINSSY